MPKHEPVCSRPLRLELGGIARCLAAFLFAACSGGNDPVGPSAGSGGSIPTGPGGNAGATLTGGRAGSSAGGVGNIAGSPASSGAPSVAGSLNAGGTGPGTGGTGAGGMTTPGGAGAGSPAGGTPGTAGAAGSVAGGTGGTHVRDHCVDGYEPLPVDATMKDGPADFVKNGQTDTTVQPEVINWMKGEMWQEAHFQWHNIRRCRSSGFGKAEIRGGLDICKDHADLIPADQEGSGPGDGLQFFAMHRHMIQALKQLFPKHSEQFEGWEHFPQKAEDLPEAWRANWTPFDSQMAQKMAQADDPAKATMTWATEGDFGQWIQSTSGIHGALHFKWVRSQNTDHGLGNQYANIDNYMFWKMHGWIDKVWDRYRAAKGKTPNDPDIKEAVLKQCREMDMLSLIVQGKDPGQGSECTTPAPKQTGFFVEKIRPIFESETNKCTGCHGPTGAMASLKLGGSDCIKSSDIVAALVDKPSVNGGQFKLIVPGDPDKSWLYRKVMNTAATAGCTATGGARCNTAIMPQGVSAPTLTAQEQADLRQWILDGAKAPQ